MLFMLLFIYISLLNSLTQRLIHYYNLLCPPRAKYHSLFNNLGNLIELLAGLLLTFQFMLGDTEIPYFINRKLANYLFNGWHYCNCWASFILIVLLPFTNYIPLLHHVKVIINFIMQQHECIIQFLLHLILLDGYFS